MRKLPFAFALLAICSAAAFTQTPTPTDADVVKISTKLVQVDVTVIDKNGNAVRDLRKDEIEIYQNEKKQEITNFSFISNGLQRNETKAVVPTDQTATQLPPAPIKAELVRRTIALVVTGLSFQSTYYIRRALKKFVNESMQDGDLVAIIRTSSANGILQQFTNDKRLLNAAIDEIRFDAFRNNTFAFAPIGSSGSEETLRLQEERDKTNEEFFENNANESGLFGLNFILRGMQDLPGRKSVLLITDGFSIPTEPEKAGPFVQSVRRVVDTANRASVTINTMDARGLVDTGFTAADDLTKMDGRGMLKSIIARNQKVVGTQQGPRILAEQTGGASIVNNNDLSGGVRKLLDDQSYYLIGYEPDDETFTAKVRPFHRLMVKVKRPGLKVRYRSGFFGVSDETMVKPALTSGQRLVTALVSPFAVNEIGVRLSAIFNNDKKLGSHIQSMVHVGAKDLKFTDGLNGSKIAVFDVIAASIDENGLPVDTVNQSYTLTANKAVYEKYVADGFVYGFTFPVKSAGTYQLRVALRDRGSDKIGSANQLVEVPDIEKKRIAVSGIYLENLSLEDWKKQNTANFENSVTSRLSDTSLRSFKRGSILNYAFVVFNAKLDRTQYPSLTIQTRVFCDGKLLSESSPTAISLNGQTDMMRIGAGGSLNLGAGLSPGEYVLQITVRDTLAKEKQQTRTQFLQFRIVE